MFPQNDDSTWDSYTKGLVTGAMIGFVSSLIGVALFRRSRHRRWKHRRHKHGEEGHTPPHAHEREDDDLCGDPSEDD